MLVKQKFVYKSGCIGHFARKENELPRQESLEKAQGESKYSEDEWTSGLESAMSCWCFDHPLGIVTVHEGVAIDARLVQSASHPRSKEKLEEEKKIRETPKGKLDKTGKPLKFSRDLESDWTVKNNIPHYGLKEHASVDARYGFVLATEITPTSFHDSPYLPLCVASSCHTKNPIKKAYADKGYFGKDNRGFFNMNNIEDGIMRKATRGTELTRYEKERNKTISKIRYIVEQYFGISHLHYRAHRARFTKMIRNAMDGNWPSTSSEVPKYCKQHKKGGGASYEPLIK